MGKKIVTDFANKSYGPLCRPCRIIFTNIARNPPHMTDQHRTEAFRDNQPYAWEEIPADTPPDILAALGGPNANRVEPGRAAVRVVRSGESVPWSTPGELVL